MARDAPPADRQKGPANSIKKLIARTDCRDGANNAYGVINLKNMKRTRNPRSQLMISAINIKTQKQSGFMMQMPEIGGM